VTNFDRAFAKPIPATFIIKLEAPPGTDGIRALRWALKLLWRRYRLRCLDVR
jgi:hypothetical protein